MARGGIWKGSISFGLLNIPVSLQTANKSKDLHFSMLDEKDFSPIKYKKVNASSGKEVSYDKIIKGFEYESGEYVVLSKSDFKAANPKATQTVDIEDFVPLIDIDTMLFDKPYYLVPQKNGEKGYFLLRDALAKTKKVAVGKIVIRTKQHLVAVMPREDYLVLEILRFAHEVIDVKSAEYLEDIGTKGKYNPKELKMAEELIQGMTDKWDPTKYKDTYYDDIMKLIKQKIKAGKGHTVTQPDEVEDVDDSKSSKVVDLLPLLRASLDAKKGKQAKSGSKATQAKPKAKRSVRHETAG